MFEQIFLDSTDLQKFQMYRALKTLDSYGFTINDLSIKMRVTYQQAYNIFRELLGDIEQITGKTGKVSAKRVMSQENFTISVDDYRLFLLNQSIQFQFIDYLIQATSLSVDKFCQDRFISRSTLTRKTLPLRQFLGEYGIKISFTKPALTGDERKIRLFIFSFYWFSYHGVRWPIAAIQPQQLSKVYRDATEASPSAMIALQEMLFWGVCRLRIVRGHVLRPSQRYDRLFVNGVTASAELYTKEMFPKLTTAEIKAESQFFRFYQLSRLRFGSLRDNWLEMYATIMNDQSIISNYIKRLSAFLEEHWDSKAPTLITDNMPLMTNIIRIAATFYLLDGPAPLPVDFYDQARELYPHTKMYQDLYNFNAGLPTNFKILRDSARPLTRLICYLLSPQMKYFDWDSVVRCKMLLDDDSINLQRINSFLSDMSFVQIMGPDEPIEKADLVLIFADDEPIFPTGSNKITLVKWHNNSDIGDLFRLYRAAKTTFLRKINYNEKYPYLQL